MCFAWVDQYASHHQGALSQTMAAWIDTPCLALSSVKCSQRSLDRAPSSATKYAAMDRTVDAGLVAMESGDEPPWVRSFLRSLSYFKFADRSKGRGEKQASRVLARCVIDAGARTEGDT